MGRLLEIELMFFFLCTMVVVMMFVNYMNCLAHAKHRSKIVSIKLNWINLFLVYLDISLENQHLILRIHQKSILFDLIVI